MTRMKKMQATLAAISATASFAHAQSVLEEVIVTAQKREQSVQELAGSITAIDSRVIEDRGITRVEDVMQLTPGLNYSEQTGNQFITIRGIGLQVDTGVGEPGVAMHIDGIYQPRTSMGSLKSKDLERIEVLRGPQGTLYGRNATGGIINLISKAPSDQLEAGISLGAGSWDLINGHGYVSGPLVDNTISGRASIWYSDHEGYGDNLGTGPDPFNANQHQGFRGALRYTPTDLLSVDFAIMYQEEEFETVQQQLDLSTPEGSGVFELLGLYPDDTLRTDEVHAIVSDRPYPQGEKETTSYTLTVVWDISDNVSFRSLTGYIDHDLGPHMNSGDNASPSMIAVGTPEFPYFTNSKSWSQEFNFSGVGLNERLDWVAGVYYFNEEYEPGFSVVFFPPASSLFGAQTIAPGASLDATYNVMEEETTSYAAYGDLTYALTESLRINLGLRYADDEKKTKQLNSSDATNLLPVDLPILGGAAIIPPGETLNIPGCDVPPNFGSTEETWDNWLPKARIEWDSTANSLLYAQWQEGFKGGGTNLTTCEQQFDPEEVAAWEIGLKNTLLDDSMILNLSAFFYDYEDLQVLTFDETGTQVSVFNVPESEIYGAELEWTWAAAEWLTLDSNIAYLHTEVTDAAPSFNSVVSLQNLAIGITDQTLAVEDYVGNPLPRSPELTALLGATFKYVNDLGEFSLRGEVYYSDEIAYRVFDDNQTYGDSYTTGNIFANYSTPSGHVSVNFFVKNLSDEEYLVNLLHSVTAGTQGFYAPERHWGVEVSYRYE